MKPKYPKQPNNDVLTVFNMLTPKPKPLLYKPRTLVRHGSLTFFSSNTMSKKPRYFFLFTDCLLITKKKTSNRFRLRVFIHLRSNVKLQEKDGSLEFRLLVPVLTGHGRSKKPAWRPIIMFARDQPHKKGWVRDLKHCLWNGSGRIGPDPSGVVPYTGPVLSAEELERQRARQRAIEEAEEARELSAQGGVPASAGELNYIHSSDEDEDASREAHEADLYPKDAASDPFLGDLLDFRFDPGAAGPSAAPPAGVALAHEQSFAAFDSLMGMSSANDFFSSGLTDTTWASTAPNPNPNPNPTPAFDPFAAPPYAAAVDPTTASAGAGAGGLSAFLSAGMFDDDPYAASARGAQLGAAALDVAGAMGGLKGEAQAGGAAQWDDVGALGLSVLPDAQGVEDSIDELAVSQLEAASRAISDIVSALERRERRGAAAALAADEPLTMGDVSDALTDSAGAMARAAQALLASASAAQAERIRAGELTGGKKYHSDPKWANGLVSAGQYLVATVRHLVETADAVAAGKCGEERLIAAAREVGAATAQLLAAHRAKVVDPNSKAHRALEDAAKGITQATNALVAQVSRISERMREEREKASDKGSQDKGGYQLTQAQVAEIEAQSRIIKLEKEAELARRELEALRKQKYGN